MMGGVSGGRRGSLRHARSDRVAIGGRFSIGSIDRAGSRSIHWFPYDRAGEVDADP
jgi:hypothetical protein